MSRLRTRLTLVPLWVKLVVAVLALSAAGLAISGAVTATVLRRQLVEQVDSDLLDNQSAVLVALRNVSRLPPGYVSPYYGASLVGGEVVQALPVAGGAPRLPQRITANQIFTADAQSGTGRWRVVVVSSGGDSGVVIGASLRAADDTVHRVLAIEAVVGLVVLVLLAAVGYGAVHTSLRPLREVEQTAGAIAGGDLARRVPRQDDRTEVGRLATSFNLMLGRIERAFEAERASEAQARASEAKLRQFVADASHELRTPLTSIRGFAELYRQGAVPPGKDLDRVMGRVEGEATRMGQLVEEMLLLARLDQSRPLETRPVDLLRLAADAVHDVQAVDPDRPVRLDADEEGPAPVVLGDEARLRQVLVNLLGNAVTHTPAGTPVEVRLQSAGGTVCLEVADEGPGLTAEQVQHVFERFYRADGARTRASGGSGLGLSIVQAVVQAHGGRVGVRSSPGQGATFLVELPLAA